MNASGWDDSRGARRARRRCSRSAQHGRAELPPAEPAPAGGRCPSRDAAPARRAAPPADREVAVLLTMQRPRVVVFGDLLSADECDELIDLARTAPGALRDGGHRHRRQRGQCRAHQRRHVLRARRDAAASRASSSASPRCCDWPVENGEGLQILRYRPGRRVPAALRLLRPGRARHAGDPEARRPARGLARHVPEHARSAAARRSSPTSASRSRRCGATPSSSATTGRTHPPRTLHGGAPVTDGEKWVATKWLREGGVRLRPRLRPRPSRRAAARARASRVRPGCACAARRWRRARRARRRSGAAPRSKPRSHCISSSASAWPEKPSRWLTCGAHRHVLAEDLHLAARRRPACAPRVPPTWKPGKTMWWRGCGAIAFRWCSTRPPVAMPLAEMITLGQRERVSCSDCCASPTSARRRSGARPRARRRAAAGGACWYSAVACDGHRAVEVDRQVGRDLAGAPSAAAAPAAAPARGRPRTTAAAPSRRAARSRG